MRASCNIHILYRQTLIYNKFSLLILSLYVLTEDIVQRKSCCEYISRQRKRASTYLPGRPQIVYIIFSFFRIGIFFYMAFVRLNFWFRRARQGCAKGADRRISSFFLGAK